jgi:hypothetical protein
MDMANVEVYCIMPTYIHIIEAFIWMILTVSVWTMIGKIAWLMAIEAAERGQLFINPDSLGDRDSRAMFLIMGPIMILVTMLMLSVKRITLFVVPILNWISNRVKDVRNAIDDSITQYKEDLKNRWDK